LWPIILGRFLEGAMSGFVLKSIDRARAIHWSFLPTPWRQMNRKLPATKNGLPRPGPRPQLEKDISCTSRAIQTGE